MGRQRAVVAVASLDGPTIGDVGWRLAPRLIHPLRLGLRRNRAPDSRFGPHPLETTPLLFYGLPAMVLCVLRLTKQEQLVLCVVLSLLLVGWVVKVYRTAHPPGSRSEQPNTKYHASPEF